MAFQEKYGRFFKCRSCGAAHGAAPREHADFFCKECKIGHLYQHGYAPPPADP